MFQRILAAVDGTELAEEVLDAAIAISKRFDGDVHVVHAVHSGVLAGLLKDDEDDGAVMGPDGPVQDEGGDCDAVVQRMHERAEMLGSSISVHTPEGSPGEEIVRVAEEMHADLVVLGAREKSLVRRLLIGSVSGYVIENSPVSTLIVKPGP